MSSDVVGGSSWFLGSPFLVCPFCESGRSFCDQYTCTVVADFRIFKPENEDDYNSMYWQRTGYIDGEDSELSWFNSGVRVGVGIGLGICLGIGVGVGLLVRSYQATARILHRRLI